MFMKNSHLRYISSTDKFRDILGSLKQPTHSFCILYLRVRDKFDKSINP